MFHLSSLSDYYFSSLFICRLVPLIFLAPLPLLSPLTRVTPRSPAAHPQARLSWAMGRSTHGELAQEAGWGMGTNFLGMVSKEKTARGRNRGREGEERGEKILWEQKRRGDEERREERWRIECVSEPCAVSYLSGSSVRCATRVCLTCFCNLWRFAGR